MLDRRRGELLAVREDDKKIWLRLKEDIYIYICIYGWATGLKSLMKQDGLNIE